MPVPEGTAWGWMLAGGVGLFLYGARLMGDALTAVTGTRARRWLALTTDQPLMGVATGAVVTALLQSSSGTTVIVLGLVHGGLISLPGAAAVIMGANIGTTLTNQLTAFSIESWGLPLVALGAPLALTVGQKRKSAMAVLGVGLLLVGLGAIGAATRPLAADPLVPRVLASVAGRPFLGLLMGIGLTTALDSSSAAIAVLQRLADIGVMTVGQALPILFGDNIGTTTATLAAAFTMGSEARRAAGVHVMFNVLGTVLLWPLISLLPCWLPALTDVPGRQIAHAHTIFNVMATALLLPFRHQMLRAVEFIGGRTE